jgi:hypothetical protein
LEGEHEVGSSLGVIPQIPLRAGAVDGLVLSEPGCELFQSLISYLIPMLVLLQLLPVEGLLVFDSFDESLGHLYDGLGVIGGEGEEVLR